MAQALRILGTTMSPSWWNPRASCRERGQGHLQVPHGSQEAVRLRVPGLALCRTWRWAAGFGSLLLTVLGSMLSPCVPWALSLVVWLRGPEKASQERPPGEGRGTYAQSDGLGALWGNSAPPLVSAAIVDGSSWEQVHPGATQWAGREQRATGRPCPCREMGDHGWTGVCSQEGSWGSGMRGALARWVGHKAAQVERVGLSWSHWRSSREGVGSPASNSPPCSAAET